MTLQLGLAKTLMTPINCSNSNSPAQPSTPCKLAFGNPWIVSPYPCATQLVATYSQEDPATRQDFWSPSSTKLPPPQGSTLQTPAATQLSQTLISASPLRPCSNSLLPGPEIKSQNDSGAHLLNSSSLQGPKTVQPETKDSCILSSLIFFK